LDVKQDEEETTVDLIEEPRSCDVAVGYWALKYCGGSVVEQIYTFPREDEETNLEEQKLQSRCGQNKIAQRRTGGIHKRQLESISTFQVKPEGGLIFGEVMG
jgi:hypothetical protein